MRAALAGLTLRARSLLTAGLALAGCAVVLGQRDLLRAAVLLVALPLTAAVVVARTHYRLSCARHLDPPRVEAGRSSTVRLRLDNVSRLPTGVLLMQDALPPALGSSPRFVLDRVQPRGVREVSYPVRSEVRGRFRVGPLSVRLTDPFGLVELTRAFSTTDELVVTPVVTRLPHVSLGGDWSSGGDGIARAVAATGLDDAATREYREGDDLRKVHWRSTARMGELMVRREEQPFTSRATLLLDTRADAHHGAGPGSSLEWAVSAVASIGVALLRDGFALQVLDSQGEDLVPRGVPVTEGALLDALADVQPTRGRDLGTAISALHDAGGQGLLVAVLGQVDPEQAEQLGRLRHSAGRCVGVLVDTPTWAGAQPGSARYDTSHVLLTRTGWRLLPVRHGTTLSSVWPLAARTSTHESGPAAAQDRVAP